MTINRIVQTAFGLRPFTTKRFNLHCMRDRSCSTVVVFVHGFGGRGYGTWQDFPKYLFERGDPPTVDVAVFDYVSGPRRRPGRHVSIDHTVAQLSECVRELQTDYESIFLVGHSLGGVICQAVAKEYLTERGLNSHEPITSLAAIMLIAAPRAGTGLAIPFLSFLFPELKTLRRFSQRVSSIDEFFSSYVQSENYASPGNKRFIVPLLACVAGRDSVVHRFSSTFGIPRTQRQHITGGHKSIAKPATADDAQVIWLVDEIAKVAETRAQWKREQTYSRSLPPRPGTPRLTFVTEFWGALGADKWEHVYNDVRRAFSTEGVAFYDRRDAPNSDVDMLITASDASSVLARRLNERQKVMQAYGVRQDESAASVGISTIGDEHEAARRVIDTWIAEKPTLAGLYTGSAPDESGLHEIYVGWLELMLNRHPLRRPVGRFTEQVLRSDPRSYDSEIGGDAG